MKTPVTFRHAEDVVLHKTWTPLCPASLTGQDEKKKNFQDEHDGVVSTHPLLSRNTHHNCLVSESCDVA